ALINLTETWLYSSQSMQFLFNQSIHLMFSEKTDKLNLLRQINWLSLKMARIGNWLYTWKREIGGGDFTSGVFTLGIDRGIFKLNTLKPANKKKIISLIQKSKIEQELLQEWQKCYNELKSFRGRTQIDIPKLICGLKKTLSLEASLAKKIK
ncbi:MAG: hypothetical protein Q8N55_02980, partial [bacterium]|nr:hypothetical protein [bacterium]